LRRKFLVRGELDESRIRAILEPILLGTSRTTHKVKFKTSKGVVEYTSIPLGSNLGRYSDVGVSNILRKIYLWSRDNTEELEEMLQSNNISVVEIVKDGPGTLELKK
jgi:hypothetical protein